MNRAGFFKAIGGAIAATVGIKYVPKAWTSEPFRCMDLKFKEPLFRGFIVKKYPDGILTRVVHGDSELEVKDQVIDFLIKEHIKFGEDYDHTQYSFQVENTQYKNENEQNSPSKSLAGERNGS